MSPSPSPPFQATALSPCNPFLITPYDMTPETCDRASYTRGLCAPPLPASAHPAWLVLALHLRALYHALGFHAAMEPNLSQTFSTPANSKNNIYFMWDFVGRTLHMLYLVPASLDEGKEAENETFCDVLSRCILIVQLLTDRVPGKLDGLTEGTYPDQKGRHPELREEVREATEALGRVVEGLPREAFGYEEGE